MNIKQVLVLYGVIWLFLFVGYAIFAFTVGAFRSATLGWAVVAGALAIYTTISSAFITLIFAVASAIVVAIRKRTKHSSDDRSAKAGDDISQDSQR